MNDVDVVRELVTAAGARDATRVRSVAAPAATWTTPKGSVRPLVQIATEVVPPEHDGSLAVTREGHRYEQIAPGRVLVLYETVYRWTDGEVPENRVSSGYVADVRDGRVTGVRAFLDAGKAIAAAEGDAPVQVEAA